MQFLDIRMKVVDDMIVSAIKDANSMLKVLNNSKVPSRTLRKKAIEQCATLSRTYNYFENECEDYMIKIPTILQTQGINREPVDVLQETISYKDSRQKQVISIIRNIEQILNMDTDFSIR